MTPLEILSGAWAIAKIVVDMLLAKRAPADIASVVALESAAFYAAQSKADAKAKAKFPGYRP